MILSNNGNRPFFLEFNISNDDTFKLLMEVNQIQRKLLKENEKLIKIYEIQDNFELVIQNKNKPSEYVIAKNLNMEMSLKDLMTQVHKLNCETNDKEYENYDLYMVLDTGKEIFVGDFVDKYNLQFHYITRFSKLKYIFKAIRITFPLKNNEVKYLRTQGEKQLKWATLKEKLIEQFSESLPAEFSILLHENETTKHVQQDDFVSSDCSISI